MRRLAAVLLLLFTLTAAADTTERLSTIARVWGAVKFTHPFLGYREDIDWDAAGVAAAERARGSEPLERIVADMLGALGDPMTRVVRQCVDAAVGAPAPSGDALIIPLSTLTASDLDPALGDAIRQARVIIFDLCSGNCSMPALPLLAKIEPLLFGATYELPAERYVSHRGYRSQDPELDSGYASDFATTRRWVNGAAGANASATAVFLTNDRTALPPLALAMIRAGRGKVVSVGPFGEEAAVSHVRVAAGEGHEAVVRAGELNVAGNAFSILPAVTLPGSASTEQAIAAAIETTRPAGRRRSASAPSAGRALPPYNFRREQTYASMTYPDFGYRALAAFRLWNVIEYFYGYPHLIGDWDARLPEIVNLLTNAASQREYDLGLAKAMTWVPDGHSQVFAPSWTDLRGRFGAPFALMPVEGKPVVVELIDPGASGPVALGDELIAIDGRPAADRYAELNEYVSGSHEAARAYYITGSLPNGPEGEVVYSFRKPDGTTYDARIRRAAYARVAPAKPWRILDGNIGYVDLRWLEPLQVNQMVTELMGTRGLIFDIRNYPRGVFPVLALRFNTTGGPATVAAFRVPLLKGGRGDVEQFTQTLSSSSQPKYTGRSVALINERAQSQSEHTCLVLEALHNTTFVGSPTVGANGNVSMMVMPGSIYIMFTGMDVRHLDGRQLQRVGIVPHVEVPRTVGAFAEGRDEVLEKAVEILRQ
jgi:C-terminal processing protease CtpA/Prc